MILQAYLKARGYGEPIPDPINREVLVYYKKMQNTDKHQIEVNEWHTFNLHGRQSNPSYEVMMTYETEFGVWATTKFYGLDAEQLINMLPVLEERLAKSLVCMGANPMHYRWDGDH